VEITFLGATSTVTGSRYLVSSGRKRVLVDCGLFQGLKQLRLRNREPFPIDPRAIHSVIVSHAHLDHSGYLPVLVKDGFRGPIYCTPATADLLAILLPDSGHLQEEEANHANRHGYSRHNPALPLYTRHDAEAVLELLNPTPFEETTALGDSAGFSFHLAGHIPGAAMVSLRGRDTRLLFSGDLGRPGDPVLPPPAAPPATDVLVVEATYGGRHHPASDPLQELENVIRSTAARGGALVIPAFAVGRTQQILYLLHRLTLANRIPWIPIFLDSPMANRATEMFRAHIDALRLTSEEARAVAAVAHPVGSVPESKAIDRMPYPRIIISASGMATGGRVIHHLKALAGDPRNTILFTGFQAAGTRGAAMIAGAKTIKIHGQYVRVNAEVRALDSLSAHADEEEIIRWLQRFESPPAMTFLTHGEPVAIDMLRHRIEETLGWEVRVPEYREMVALSGLGRGRGAVPAVRIAPVRPAPTTG
jgi:metallo-beta-lactamase family protein